MKLFGYKKPDNIKLRKFNITKKVKIGGEISFDFQLITDKKNLGKLRIEYAVDFVRQRNKTGRKVFKISEGYFNAAEHSVNKKYSFKKISTRKYYAGKHTLSVIVNGVELSNQSFVLTS